MAGEWETLLQTFFSLFSLFLNVYFRKHFYAKKEEERQMKEVSLMADLNQSMWQRINFRFANNLKSTDFQDLFWRCGFNIM